MLIGRSIVLPEGEGGEDDGPNENAVAHEAGVDAFGEPGGEVAADDGAGHGKQLGPGVNREAGHGWLAFWLKYP